MKTLALTGGVLGLAGIALAETVYLGANGSAEKTVSSGTATESNGYFADSQAGWFSKLGEGGLVFPLSSVLSPAPLKIAHRQGLLRIAKGSPSVTRPTLNDAPAVIREKAAFWVDSRTNLGYHDESEGTVADWYDVRETAADISAGTTKYVSAHAVQLWDTSGIVYPRIAENTDDGNKYINFNGVHASTSMKFSYPGESSTTGKIVNVRHAFTSHRMTTGFGAMWGVSSSVSPDNLSSFVFGDYKGDFANNPKYLCILKNAYGDYRAPNCRFWRDGVQFDPVNTSASARTEVLELATGLMLTGMEIGNFFCDRNYYQERYAKRCGGDDIGEAIFFTETLTEEERLQVSQYMLNRWRPGLATGGVSVSTAPGATVEITGAADDVSIEDVTFPCSFDILKTGAGAATLQRLYTTRNIGALKIASGSVSYESGELTVKTGPGERISATKDTWDTLSIVKGSTDSGTIEIAGDGAVNVPDIPDGTEKLVVSGGRVVLGGKASTESVIPPGGDVWATIQNGGFEDGTLADTGWTVVNSGADVAIQNYATGKTWKKPYHNADDTVHYGAPEGTKVLMMVQNPVNEKPVFVHGKISFPVAGVYDLSLYAAPRSDYQYVPSNTDILLFREGETNVVARLKTRYENRGYTKYVFRLPPVEAGDYRIGFRNCSEYAQEQDLAIDDLRAKLVVDADSSEVAVPAGDFERETYPDRKDANLFNLRTWFGVTGWTLNNPNFGTTSEQTPDVAVVSSHTAGGVYRESLSPTGDRQLLFTGPYGSAVSDAFPVPAGTYSLRFDAARITRASFRSGSPYYLPYNQPNFEVKVFKNGSAEAAAVYTTGLISSFLPVRCDNQDVTFDVVAGDSISLEIRQINDEAYTDGSSRNWLACGVIDNVRLVDHGKIAGNLVKNPTFKTAQDASTDWTFDNCRDSSNTKSDIYRATRPGTETQGYSVCDGVAVRVCQCACMHQEIDVPSAGWYKLSFWTCSRADYLNDPETITHKYGGNQVRAWWYPASGGDTNEFYRTACIFSTNFLEQTAYVKLPQGRIRFGLQGVNRNGTEVVAPSSTDATFYIDCISLVAAEPPTRPDVLSGKSIQVARGANLRLDFDGQVELESFEHGSRRLSGVINASRFPDLISGEGSFYVEPKGILMIFR